MNLYHVRSGKLNKNIRANDSSEAVRKAIKHHNGNLAIIIECSLIKQPDDDHTWYSCTERILKDMGLWEDKHETTTGQGD